MKVLICGGAGYIGSHCVSLLVSQGIEVVIVDNLSTGHVKALPRIGTFYNINLCSFNDLKKVFEENKIDIVFHFAASSIVSDSMINWFDYYQNNVVGTMNLLKVMDLFNVKNLIFSSTAAVYKSLKRPIIELDLVEPSNVYGQTKLVVEQLIEWNSKINKLNYVIFRYFNAAGASIDSSIGESHTPETHVIPNFISSILNDRTLTIYGDDYNTIDGTCVRDYVHVLDIAEAHLLAMKKMMSTSINKIYNLGTTIGFSVKQILSEIEIQLNRKASVSIYDRRPGDADTLVANSVKVYNDLNWTPKNSDLNNIIHTAINWQKNKKF